MIESNTNPQVAFHMGTAWGDADVEAAREGNSHKSSGGAGRIAFVAGVLVTIAAAVGFFLLAYDPPSTRADRVLPGEFEHHEALFLAWPGKGTPQQNRVLMDIVDAARERTKLLVAVPDAAIRLMVIELLNERRIPLDTVQFIEAPLDTKWTRDFGPLVVKLFNGEYTIVDVDYDTNNEDPRPGDENIPQAVAAQLSMDYAYYPLVFDGGHLLSNGTGLCLLAKEVLQINADAYGYGERRLARMFRDALGAEQIVYLDSMVGERTGHIDMFATFTAPDKIVVGQYSPDQDPINAEILDRNAERLSKVITASGPLKVYRVPMPPRVEDNWPTYTNVLYVNGTLLMPAYWDNDPEGQTAAIKLFQELLPGWRIVTIDCAPLIVNNGSLHCVAINMYRLDSRPDEKSPDTHESSTSAAVN